METFDKQLQDLISKINQKMEAIPAVLAETAVAHFQNALLKKEWNGVPYEPYKKKKQPTRGSLMYRTGNLFHTIRPSLVTADKVVISAGSSAVKYARVHNEGETIQRQGGTKVLTFKKHTRGKLKGRTLFTKANDPKANFSQKAKFGAYSIKMPKRQFMGKSEALIKDIEDRFKVIFKTI